jgi:hypothetical protein
MIQKQVQIGRDTFTVSGDNLQEVLQQASALELIGRRAESKIPGMSKPTLSHRHVDGFDFYEAIAFVRGQNGSKMAKKQLGNSNGELFLAANEPWVVYDADQDAEFVRFDFLTDDAKEWGFDESAVEGWVKATKGKKGKLRIYKPVK